MWNFRSQNLWKKTISFVTSVCPSARNNSATTGRIFVNFDTWEFFEYLSRKFKFQENLTGMTRVAYVTTNIFFLSYLAQFFLEWEMFQTKVVEKINTHFVFNNPLFSLSKIVPLWDNVESIQGDSFGTKTKKMRISQRLFIRFWTCIYTYDYIPCFMRSMSILEEMLEMFIYSSHICMFKI
jgi:hypothetical protein